MRPTLAECLGVSTRWQALAVLASEMHAAGLISAAGECLDASVSVHCRDDERLADHAASTARDARAWGNPIRVTVDAQNHARAYAFIAWELLAELRERRARERWEADVVPRNCCGRCDRCGWPNETSPEVDGFHYYAQGRARCAVTYRTSCAGCGRKLEEVKRV